MRELKFLLAVWKANLQSVMEYRVAFLLQVFGMMVNNAIYFLIWVIYFERFKEVRGWGINDMFVTYGIIASGWDRFPFIWKRFQSGRNNHKRAVGLLSVAAEASASAHHRQS